MKTKEKYVAYSSIEDEFKTFDTFNEAEVWLSNTYKDLIDAEMEIYSEDSCNGGDYIAQITHRSKYIEIDSIKDYPTYDEINGEYTTEDGEPWPYADEYDSVGSIVFQGVGNDN